MSKDQNLVFGIVVVLLMLGGVVLLARRPVQSTPYVRIRPNGGIKKLQITEEEPVARGARRYQNEEVWDIDWTADGLPKRVTIHRDAIQS